MVWYIFPVVSWRFVFSELGSGQAQACCYVGFHRFFEFNVTFTWKDSIFNLPSTSLGTQVERRWSWEFLKSKCPLNFEAFNADYKSLIGNEKESQNKLDQILTPEDEYLHTISKLGLHLSKPKKNDGLNSFPQDLFSHNSEKCKVCLPKLETEKFEADVINWSSFWNQFFICDSCKSQSQWNYWIYIFEIILCDSTKLTISGLSLTSENYKKDCWSSQTRLWKYPNFVEFLDKFH